MAAAPHHTIEGAHAHHNVDDVSAETPSETASTPRRATAPYRRVGPVRLRADQTAWKPDFAIAAGSERPTSCYQLGFSKDLAYYLTARGELPSLRFGRRAVVPTKLLLTLLNGEGAVESAREQARSIIGSRGKSRAEVGMDFFCLDLRVMSRDHTGETRRAIAFAPALTCIFFSGGGRI